MEITKAEIASAAAAQQHTHSPQELMGSEILVKALQAEGVKYIWGYPGGAVLYIYDALYKQDTMQHVLVRHEQAAVHAADGYARATGDVGVALVTSGPGVTNAVTGIATAYMDSIPMVIITGQVPTAAIGLDAFQECDTVGITRPIVKHNFLVKDAKDIALTLKKAFHIARSGRPGPGLVDIPKDLTAAVAEYAAEVPREADRVTAELDQRNLEDAVSLLKKAKKPFIEACTNISPRPFPRFRRVPVGSCSGLVRTPGSLVSVRSMERRTPGRPVSSISQCGLPAKAGRLMSMTQLTAWVMRRTPAARPWTRQVVAATVPARTTPARTSRSWSARVLCCNSACRNSWVG